jgi:hypothetical protein
MKDAFASRPSTFKMSDSEPKNQDVGSIFDLRSATVVQGSFLQNSISAEKVF